MADTKRGRQRARTVLPVRVFGRDSRGNTFTDIAHTLDLTQSGTRIGGLKVSLLIGEVIGVQRGTNKARFKVVWVGAANTRCERQVGLCSLEPEKCIWPAELLAVQKRDSYTPPPIPDDGPALATPPLCAAEERRTSQRLSCKLDAEWHTGDAGVKFWARCIDISPGGCYLETRSPLLSGTVIRLKLSNDKVILNAWGVVRVSHPTLGMGIKFDNLDATTRVSLQFLLATIYNTKATSTTSAPAPPVGFDMRGHTRALIGTLQVLENDLGASDLNSELAKILRVALDGMREIVGTLQRIADAPLRNDEGLVSKQLLLHLMRFATAVNLNLSRELSITPSVPAIQGRELFQATHTLLARLAVASKEDIGALKNRAQCAMQDGSEAGCRPN